MSKDAYRTPEQKVLDEEREKAAAEAARASEVRGISLAFVIAIVTTAAVGGAIDMAREHPEHGFLFGFIALGMAIFATLSFIGAIAGVTSFGKGK